MTLNGHNTLWNGMFQAVIGHIPEMLQNRAKITINH